MDFNTLLLIAIIWLLWRIHQGLNEANDRQRSVSNLLQQLGASLAERQSPAPDPEPGSRRRNTGSKP
ncbi:MAG: hypothetical protein RBS22_02310 [Spongiibacteraceae bacterium]|jgi:hypothetical protein|nr:hypothetical protein [Spongiibacteraceae bacterium]